MKAIETTAVLDAAARIVPRRPLPEHPTGEFRVILLLEDSSSSSTSPSVGAPVSEEKSSALGLIHPEVLEITGLVPEAFDAKAEYRRDALEKHR
ncbi:MAG TPA: hypothetical protein VK633_11135 [Verrucomicrobiae bacterium]|nr:hypothetical protein [Verrucomicrobiae bacterium]